jgi:hypothetical protein
MTKSTLSAKAEGFFYFGKKIKVRNGLFYYFSNENGFIFGKVIAYTYK